MKEFDEILQVKIWSSKFLRFRTRQSHFPRKPEVLFRKWIVRFATSKYSILIPRQFDTHIVSWRKFIKRSRKQTLNSRSFIWKEAGHIFNDWRERSTFMAIRSFDVDSGKAFAPLLHSIPSPSAIFSIAVNQIKLFSDDAKFIRLWYNSLATSKFPVVIACRDIR